MRESGVNPVTQQVIYRAVRLAGEGAWESDAKEKAKGLKRIIPEDKIDSIPPNLTWPQYRSSL
jgi:hypothetical protein